MSQNNIRLANVYLQQADVARRQGEVEPAVKYFEKALGVYKTMAEEAPECWELVADTIEKIAATYQAAGDTFLPKAERAFQEAAQLRESIAKRPEVPSED